MDSEEDTRVKTLIISMCSKKKALQKGKAKDVYSGTLIKLVSYLASKLNARWFILSARYGLISSDEIIERYDTYLANLTKKEINALMDLVSAKCWNNKLELLITVLSKRYAKLLDPCEFYTNTAIVIGQPPANLFADETITFKPKGIGRYYKILKLLNSCSESHEEFVRCVKERARDREFDFVEL